MVRLDVVALSVPPRSTTATCPRCSRAPTQVRVVRVGLLHLPEDSFDLDVELGDPLPEAVGADSSGDDAALAAATVMGTCFKGAGSGPSALEVLRRLQEKGPDRKRLRAQLAAFEAEMSVFTGAAAVSWVPRDEQGAAPLANDENGAPPLPALCVHALEPQVTMRLV